MSSRTVAAAVGRSDGAAMAGRRSGGVRGHRARSLLGCVLGGLAAFWLAACPQAGEEAPAGSLPPPATRPIEFGRDIRPLFEKHCVACHGPEKAKSGLRLDERARALQGGSNLGPAVQPGRSDSSPLVRVVAGLEADLIMPPKGERLSAAEIGLLRAWIDQGAPWPEEGRVPAKEPHWAFRPVNRPGTPDPANRRWLRNPVDAFVLDRLERSGLGPAPEADRRTLIRRLYYDLIGLPPTPEAVAAFERDRSGDAHEQLVDRLLGSPRFGEKWAAHWLDVVRFAETHGFEMNQPRPNAWPYRDYVIKALNEDKPYDRFITEQLAGDALGVDEATGFLVAGAWDQVKSPDVVLTSNQRADELHDIVGTVGTTFLGLTVACARCHEHKFDPISQREYYAVKAVFEGVQHGERSWRAPDEARRTQEAIRVRDRLTQVDSALAAFEPMAFPGTIVVLDEEMPSQPGQAASPVMDLVPRTARGEYPAGTGRGEREDPGDSSRPPNFTPSYRAWQNVAGRDVFAWHPGVAGRFEVFLSWGSGWATHARDARYALDRDGNLETTGDQAELARVDQQRFADGSGAVPNRPLWSGFYAAGTHDFQPATRIVLRGGTTDAYVSADVILLRKANRESGGGAGEAPRLRPPVRARENTDRFAPVAAKSLRFTIRATTSAEPCLDELEVYAAGAPARNVALASLGTRVSASGTYANNELHKLEHLNDGRHGNSRSWISNESGRGWVELEFAEEVAIDRVVWGRDREERFGDRLATDYRIEVKSRDGDWRVVAGSADRIPYRADQPVSPVAGLAAADAAGRERLGQLLSERAGLTARLKELDGARMAYAGEFKSPEPTRRFHRGDPMQPREPVESGALEAIGTALTYAPGGPPTTEQQRRLDLARWIADRRNPLTARVLVNRLWQQHFGEGLVSTPSDFGANGARPTHPELLDWLASEFMAQGWSQKHIHRLIVCSATYRQSSAADPAALGVDAGSRLLWRFPPRRVEAEAIRDTILALSGNLDLTAGGPGYSLFEPNDNYVRVYAPRKEFGPTEWRRMIYATRVRQRVDGVFGAFDCPDGGQAAPRRTRSTTPLQALNLLNSGFTLQQAAILAKRLEQDAGPDPVAQVRRAFALAFNRAPDPAELRAASSFVQAQGLRAFCRVLFNANELVYLF